MRIGVVSDTHGYFDPALPSLLNGVDEILHAGDVGTQEVLDQLRVIAPVRAVRGNVDSPELGLELSITLKRDRAGVHVVHQLPAAQSALREWAKSPNSGQSVSQRRRLFDSFPENCQVIIFGHTHEPCAYLVDGRLFFNPGAAGKRRFTLPRCFGFLDISSQGIRATFESLENSSENLPDGVWLPFGGL